MITQMGFEYAITAYVMTKHGIGVPIIGSMQRYWSAMLSRGRRYVVPHRSGSEDTDAASGKLKR